MALLSNDDNNKVFYIGFRTPPHNSTGVAHIVEHTVLCGSKEFPVKDPFIELAKGSLNTFLNAMTFPDKTLYPVASCNDKDFKNLMHVYLDAVFYPNIHNEKKIFEQEGWHYELESAEDELTINGVVYNEMKGALSSPEDVLSEEELEENTIPFPRAILEHAGLEGDEYHVFSDDGIVMIVGKEQEFSLSPETRARLHKHGITPAHFDCLFKQANEASDD